MTAAAENSADDGSVSLYQDGAPMPGQARAETFCAGPDGTLFDAPSASMQDLPGPYGTPGVFSLFGCMTTGVPGPVVFQARPGTHTYELRYAHCGCTGTEATFSNRRLWITTMP